MLARCAWGVRAFAISSLLITAAAGQSVARSDAASIKTRAGLIEALRKKKARQVRLAEPTDRDKPLPFSLVSGVARVAGRAAGFRLRLGGLPARSGLAAGVEYVRRDLAEGNVAVRASIAGSARGFAVAGASISFPRLFRKRAVVEFSAEHRYLPSLDYYGPGADSNKTGRSDYLLEDTTLGLDATLNLTRRIAIGTFAQGLLVNVGPGRDGDFVSTDQIYTPETTPGVLQQPNFLVAGGFAGFDSRDALEAPNSGALYSARFSRYWDRGVGRYSFHRLDLEAQKYFPLLHRSRVIALRGIASLTDSAAGQAVPFYLQPAIGGPRTLRGFRAYRFYGDNSLLLNAEYRLEFLRGVDLALFADAGKVFPKWGDLSFAGLERSYGFGFRINARGNVFLRLDTGFSREGFQTWLTFDDIF